MDYGREDRKDKCLENREVKGRDISPPIFDRKETDRRKKDKDLDRSKDKDRGRSKDKDRDRSRALCQRCRAHRPGQRRACPACHRLVGPGCAPPRRAVLG